MTEGPVEPVVDSEPVELETRYQTPEELKDNPAWDVILKDLPESLHNQVKPALKEWDRNVSKRFEEIHQEYAPYKQFREAEITPEVLIQAHQLFQMLEDNPRDMYDRLGEFLQITPEQAKEIADAGQEPSGDDNDEFTVNDPRYDRLNETVETMAQLLLAKEQEAQEAAENEALDNELQRLHKEYGDFDDFYVLSVMNANGSDGDAAVAQFQTLIEDRMKASGRPPAPVVLGSGSSGLPSTGLDVTKINQKETKSLVADILAQAASQR